MLAIGLILTAHDIEREFLRAVRGGVLDILLEHARGEVVVVAAAEVVVLAVRGDVGLDGVVAVEAAAFDIWVPAEVPGLCRDVAVG